MAVTTNLESLSQQELESMLKHIRLGKEHLRAMLGPEGFHDLLQLSSLSEAQKTSFNADPQEKSGNVALVLNPIITGLLGSWLGFASYMELGLQSGLSLFLIVFVVTLISGWVGYISFKLTGKKSRDMFYSKKLGLIELFIQKKIIRLQEERAQQVVAKIIKHLGELDPNLKQDAAKQQELSEYLLHSSSRNFGKKAAIISALMHPLDQLLLSLQHKDIYLHIEKRLVKLVQQLKKLYQHLYHKPKIHEHHPAPAHAKSTFADFALNRGVTNANTYIRILTTPGVEVDFVSPSPHRWLKNNAVMIITGLAPTLLGSMGSMFVFLTGIPRALQVLHIEVPILIEYQFMLKLLGFGFALILTLYYCYSYLHSNYKSFLRDKEIQKTEQFIAEKGEYLAKLRLQYDYLLQIRSLLEQISFILFIIDYFSHQKPVPLQTRHAQF